MKTIEKVIEGHEEQVSGPKINAHRLDEFGREIVDGRPMQPPVGYVEQPSMFEQMRIAMAEASLRAQSAGFETDEEANDFYIEDDPSLASRLRSTSMMRTTSSRIWPPGCADYSARNVGAGRRRRSRIAV